MQLPTRETSVITHLGTSNILNGMMIKNVLYIPRFRYNLLSVSKLTKDLGLFLAFFPTCCIFQDICSGKVKGIGIVEHGLYVLDQTIKRNIQEGLPIGLISSTLSVNRINDTL